jgi:hypothetical protein
MKILSIVTEPKQLRYALISGTRPNPSPESSQLEKIPYPPDIDQGSGLDTMLNTLTGLVATHKPCKVTVLLSIPAQHGSQSVRPVIEALLKLACHREHQELESIHPLSLRAREKKFLSVVGKTPEQALNNGANFRPIVSKDVYLTGWSGLPE